MVWDKWEGNGQIQNVLVEQSNHVVLAPHQSVGNVGRVQPLLGLAPQKLSLVPREVPGCLDILVSERHDPGHNLLPGDCLHVVVGDLEHVEVKVANIQQALDVKQVLNRLPDEVKGEHPQAEIPQAGHVPRALGN